MRIALILVLLAGITACATSSGVMEAEGGTYMISTSAAPARGGTAGANSLAFEEAKQFCAKKGGRPVVVDAAERDVYSGGGGASWNKTGGSAGGGFAAGGSANLRFRCQQ